MTRISIVTISFNQGAYLPACLKSVGRQLGEGDEHICVDPGSTDGSREMISESGRVVSVFEPDTGPADGLNKGFARAGGSVLAYLNADDVLAEGALAVVRAFFAEHPEVDILLGAIEVIDAEGRGGKRRRIPTNPGRAELRAGAVAFYQQGMFFRRALWDRGLRFREENRTCWDYELCVDAVLMGARVETTARVLGQFRLHAASISGGGGSKERYRQAYARIAGTVEAAWGRAGVLETLWWRAWRKVDPARRLTEFTGRGDGIAGRFGRTAEVARARRGGRGSVVIAWEGLPPYAVRCVREFVRAQGDWEMVVVTAKAERPVAELERACGCAVVVIDSERRVSFAELGLAVPRHVLITSWSHAGYMSLAREVKAAGGAVTVLADNNARGSLAQLLGAGYFRARLGALYDDAWVPGRSGERLMRLFGVPAERIHTGLYAADPAVFGDEADEHGREGVVYAGQLIARKRVVELWRCWQALRPAVSLGIVGRGELEGVLREGGAPLEGGLEPAGLSARMGRASALILPSAVDHWGLVVHEAALKGCLLLVTRGCGAADDLVVHGVNGFVLRELTLGELAAALAWMGSLGDAEIARGRAVSRELAGQFSPQLWRGRLARILERQAREIERRVF